MPCRGCAVSTFDVHADRSVSRDHAGDDPARMREVERERCVGHVSWIDVRLSAGIHAEAPLRWTGVPACGERLPDERVCRSEVAPIAREHEPIVPAAFVVREDAGDPFHILLRQRVRTAAPDGYLTVQYRVYR